MHCYEEDVGLIVLCQWLPAVWDSWAWPMAKFIFFVMVYKLPSDCFASLGSLLDLSLFQQLGHQTLVTWFFWQPNRPMPCFDRQMILRLFCQLSLPVKLKLLFLLLTKCNFDPPSTFPLHPLSVATHFSCPPSGQCCPEDIFQTILFLRDWW